MPDAPPLWVSEQIVGPAGELMAGAVGGLGVVFGCERSFRMSSSGLCARRFLLSLSKASLGPDADRRILEVGSQLGNPGLIACLKQPLSHSRFVHFGYDESGEAPTYKIYLEFPTRENEAGPVPRQLLGTAFKWRVSRPEHFVTTNYYWHPGLDQIGILERMARIHAPDSPALTLAHDLLRHATLRQTNKPIRYAEALEPGNERQSYDLNIYDAGLRVKELLPILQRMGSYFHLPEAWFEEFYTGLSDSVVGHLSGGRHRNGEEFFTVYHSLEAFQGKASAS